IAVLMCFIYVFVRYKHKMKTYNMNNIFIIVGIGFILGVLAAFLGIGGGPFNVAILALCFSMNAKESALRSEERRVVKEWISERDWSSDVCSSDLDCRFDVFYLCVC